LRLVALLGWLLAAGLVAGAWWLNQKAQLFEQNTRNLKESVAAAVAAKLPEVPPAFLDSLEFTQSLDRLRDAPAFEDILADITSVRDGRLLVDKLRVDYDTAAVPTVTIQGRILSGFDEASRNHKAFLSGLSSLGYQMVDSQFSTDIQHLAFTVKLRRTAQ